MPKPSRSSTPDPAGDATSVVPRVPDLPPDAVAKQRDLLAALVNSISDEVWFCDTEKRFTLANPPALQQFGFEKANDIDVEALAARLEVYRPDGTPRPVGEAPPLRALGGEVVRNCEEIIRTPATGELRRRLVGAAPVRDAQGEIIGSVSVVRDITDLKRTEEALRRQAALVDGINRIFREALACDTEEALGGVCLTVAEELTQSKFGFIGELNAEDRLDDIAISDPGWELCRMPDHTAHRIVPGGFAVHGIYGRVLLDGKGFYTNDPASHPDRIGTPPGHPPLKAFLGAPLINAGRVVGMIGLGNREGGYRDEDLATVEALALPIIQVFMHRRAEWALQESHRRLQETLESISDAFVSYDPEWRYTYANDNATRVLRTPRAELLGRTVWEVFPAAVGTEFEQQLRRCAESGEPLAFEYYFPAMATWFECSCYPSPSGLSVYFRDITQRKESEAALMERMAELQTLMEVAPVGIWIGHDPQCRRITGNRAGHEMLRTGPNQNLSVTAPVEERPSHIALHNGEPIPDEELPMQYAAANGVEVRDSEMEIAFPNGDVIHVFGNASPLYDAHGDVRGVVATFMDVTERRRREDEVAHLNERLRRAMRETHHRVKNNLQSIAGLLDMQQMTDDAAVPIAEIERIGRHVRALASVHDVLTSEVQAHPEAETVAAEAILNKLIPLLQSILRGRRLVYDIGDVPLTIRQCTAVAVLVNECVSNAAKHGGTTVEVALEAADGAGRLRVSDDGPGFPDDFDPRTHGQTGFDLVHSLGEWDLQGQVTCRNRPQGGAVVEVSFPLR